MGVARVHTTCGLRAPRAGWGHLRPCLLSVPVCCPSLSAVHLSDVRGCAAGRWAQAAVAERRGGWGHEIAETDSAPCGGPAGQGVAGLCPEAPLLGV